MADLTEEYLDQFRNSVLRRRLRRRRGVSDLEALLEQQKNRFLELRSQKKDGALDFGKKPKRKDLPEILTDIKSLVDPFLGIEGVIEAPKIRYFSLFGQDPQAKSVRRYLDLGVLAMGIETGASYFFEYSGVFVLLTSIPFVMAYRRRSNEISKSYHFRGDSGNEIIIGKHKIATLIPAVAHEYAHDVLDAAFQEPLHEYKYADFNEGFSRGIQRYVSQSFEANGNVHTFSILPNKQLGR